MSAKIIAFPAHRRVRFIVNARLAFQAGQVREVEARLRRYEAALLRAGVSKFETEEQVAAMRAAIIPREESPSGGQAGRG